MQKKVEKLQLFTDFVALSETFFQSSLSLLKPLKPNKDRINDSDMSTGNLGLKQSSETVKSSFLPEWHTKTHVDQDDWGYFSFH